MSYETGMYITDRETREVLARWYQEHGFAFDSNYVLKDGIAGEVCGWAFSSMGNDIVASSIAHKDEGDDPGDMEYDIVPLSAISAYTYAYRLFAKTKAGQRIEACNEFSVEWFVGDVTTDNYDVSTVYIAPEDLLEAKKALSVTGKGEILWEIVENERISQLDLLADLVEVLENMGIMEIGWYLSY